LLKQVEFSVVTQGGPLTPTEEVLWRSFMRLVITLPRALGDDLDRARGMSANEYTTLMHLSEAPNRRCSHRSRFSDRAVRQQDVEASRRLAGTGADREAAQRFRRSGKPCLPHAAWLTSLRLAYRPSGQRPQVVHGPHHRGRARHGWPGTEAVASHLDESAKRRPA
jgi:hypothetical protein